MRDTSGMGSPYLLFAGDRLSCAELSAACLDGHLVEVGEGYMPADAVETSWLRAASLAPVLTERLAVTHLSAAWVHGALAEPPARHTVQRAVPQRLHHIIGRRIHYRDPRVEDADLVRIAGVRVTTPARTLADLARTPDPECRRAAELLGGSDPTLLAAALDWFDSRGVVPYKRPARALLSRIRDSQEEVTRYTS